MTQPAKSQEPSMEEILASIRRIIADDDTTKSAPQESAAANPEPQPSEVASPLAAQPEPAPVGGTEVAEQASDILDLTESMAASSPMPEPAPHFRTIDGSSDVGFDEAPEKSVAHEPGHGVDERSRLISSDTSIAVDSAFNALAQTVLVKNARTLEDLVREMLRPMLKSWLDDNLPGLVERLVRSEIERVSRGR
jgi:cell pole-organizing protein PopZ